EIRDVFQVVDAARRGGLRDADLGDTQAVHFDPVGLALEAQLTVPPGPADPRGDAALVERERGIGRLVLRKRTPCQKREHPGQGHRNDPPMATHGFLPNIGSRTHSDPSGAVLQLRRPFLSPLEAASPRHTDSDRRAHPCERAAYVRSDMTASLRWPGPAPAGI